MITAKEALELSMENKNYKEDLERYRQRVNESIREVAEKYGLRKLEYIITGNHSSTIGNSIKTELWNNGFTVSSEEKFEEYWLFINW